MAWARSHSTLEMGLALKPWYPDSQSAFSCPALRSAQISVTSLIVGRKRPRGEDQGLRHLRRTILQRGDRPYQGPSLEGGGGGVACFHPLCSKACGKQEEALSSRTPSAPSLCTGADHFGVHFTSVSKTKPPPGLQRHSPPSPPPGPRILFLRARGSAGPCGGRSGCAAAPSAGRGAASAVPWGGRGTRAGAGPLPRSLLFRRCRGDRDSSRRPRPRRSPPQPGRLCTRPVTHPDARSGSAHDRKAAPRRPPTAAVRQHLLRQPAPNPAPSPASWKLPEPEAPLPTALSLYH